MKRKELTLIKIKNKNYFHLLFIFLILSHYLIPIILFGNITLFYQDVLDAGVVYNNVLGKFYRGEQDPFDIFLNGNIKAYYMQYLLKPFSLIYSVLNTELAYWITDLAIKITSYISFFILSKKISNNFFISCLTSCVYAYFNSNALNGFGTAIFPYLFYLGLFKNELNIKHYLIIFIFGVNSDLVSSLLFAPILFLLIYFYQKDLIFKKMVFFIKLIGLFYFSMFITSLNLLYVLISIEEFHRISFFNERPSLAQNFKELFFGIFNVPNTFTDWTFVKKIPQTFIALPVIIFSLFNKNPFIKKILYIYLFYYFINFVFSLEFFENLGSGLYRITWVNIYFPFIYTLMLLILINTYSYKKVLSFFSFAAIFSFILSPSIIPYYKQNILKNSENYSNIYTFKGYYKMNEFREFKELIKKDRVISIGLDPMVAAMNGINVIDGYHNLYPQKYKIKFRKIIANELSENEKLRKYYDYWGSRVYAFVNEPKNPNLNYNAAKKIGASYLISKFKLAEEKSLIRICEDCGTSLFLYKIL